MEYLYDYRTLSALGDDSPIQIANQWGKDGWRWVNAYAYGAPGAVHVMVFEKVEP